MRPRRHSHVINSPLNPATCEERLRAGLATALLASTDASFAGRIEGGRIRALYSRQVTFGSSWSPVLRGLIQPAASGAGSRIEVRFGSSRYRQVVDGMFALFATAWIAVACTVSVLELRSPDTRPGYVALPLAGIVAVAAFIGVRRLVRRRRGPRMRADITRYVVDCCEGEVANPSQEPPDAARTAPTAPITQPTG